MRRFSSLSQHLLLGLFFLFYSGLQGQDDLCDFSSTCGPEWTCIYETELITTCYECGDWDAVGAIYEWTVEKCTNTTGSGGAACNTVTIVNTTPIVTNIPALWYTFNEVGVFQFKVKVVDPNSGAVLATPCVGGSLCQTAEVWVYGLPIPSFTTTTLNCTYDGNSNTYSSDIQIDPQFNQQLTSGGSSTVVDIDWGDGNTSQHFLTPGQPANIPHTYTWSATSAPSFSITVDASRSSPFPRPIACLGYVSYTGTFTPSLASPDVSFVVHETDCDNQRICTEGAENYTLIEVFDQNGQLVHTHHPEGETPCFDFQTNGTHRFVFYDNSGNCPYLLTYNVMLTPPTIGVLSSTDSHIRPGDPLALNLTNPDNHYVTYEILEYRPSGPFWLLFYHGPASQMNNVSIPGYITQQFTTAMLNSDFEFCIRASVVCDEADIPGQDPVNGTFSNVICFQVCAAPDDGGGGGGDNPGFTSGSNSGFQDQFAVDAKFLVYPNPGTGPFTIEWDALPTKEPGVLEVQNLLGQAVWKQTLNHGQLGGGSLDVNLPKAASGRYSIIWTTSEQRVQVGQLIIVP